ncbi:protein-tyrosine sulfotransferase 2-like isoform X2 [Mya arenaria]|nr:protein-tyrosine sulfotransferase 2-like isoform X2 [Mya arenaria]XP_052799926.1 protein-tyrosine sulfotransferase 2-like isoform X2 [Mya arenaria]XP_052799927.1 protein-tyrosine sulfotransferase 2-like isoform X2 [Mya arenaria]XP_052799928.1 protein-tyrosine sulfotransferase 2-like isoform X2 [Mya arenaria]XP_052799929.1 protein-tyrosine sulfotransferase 2-like isoform X2 [Mya arenaria]
MPSKMKRISKKGVCYLLTGSILLYLMVYHSSPCDRNTAYMVPRDGQKYMYDNNQNAIPYYREMPLIFIGGMPRSGTTLMRAMLDAHPYVRCGEETRVIPRLLGMRSNWERSELERKRLQEAGITDTVIDSAFAAFILEIIALHGEAAPHLCNKDPFTLKSSVYLKRIFPNAKFIFMIRDGRGTVHSIISRKVTITGFNLNDYKQCLSKWSTAMEVMYSQCLQVGASSCMPVYYEQLVLQPELWMRRIVKFLDVPWNESVLHHEDFIDKPGGVSVSKTEKSSDQIIKPVNLEALTKWVGNIPENVVKDMAKIAPMLRTLGYDPDGNPPNYGSPDSKVADNTLHIQQNVDFWKQREKDLLQRNPQEAGPPAANPPETNQKPQQVPPKHQAVLPGR